LVGKVQPGREADHSPPSSANRSYASSSPCAPIGVLWECFRFLQIR
jgi:hypothetical protein